MRMKLNAEWHRANRMPKNPTMAQRVRWHAAHAKACACREMPPGMAREVAKRTRRRA
jgi:hypothetical protein